MTKIDHYATWIIFISYVDIHFPLYSMVYGLILYIFRCIQNMQMKQVNALLQEGTCTLNLGAW